MTVPTILVDQINASTTFQAISPKVVQLSDGTFVVVYTTRPQFGSGTIAIRGQHFDENGAKIRDEIRFSFVGTVDEAGFDVTALSDNHIAIVAEIRKDNDGFEIVSGLYKIGGTSAVLLDLTRHRAGGIIGSNTVFNPTITHDDGLDYRVHYTTRFLGNRTLRQSGNEGGQQLDDTFISQANGSDRAQLDSDTMDNGKIVVAQDADGLNISPDDSGIVQFRVLEPNGDILVSGKTGARLEQVPGAVSQFRDAVFDVSVAALRGNNFVVTWAERERFGGRQITRFEVFNEQGEEVGSGIVARVNSGDRDSKSKVVALDDGGFFIFHRAEETGRRTEVRGARFDAAGTKIVEEFTAVAPVNVPSFDVALLNNDKIAICNNVVDASIDEGAISIEASVKLTILDIASSQPKTNAA